MSDDGLGRPVRPSTRLWQRAAEELEPPQSLRRVNETSRFVVSSVSVAGIALTGLGVVSSRGLSAGSLAFTLGAAGVCASVVAVVFALVPLTLRTSDVALQDLAAVERHFRKELSRARWARWSGGLLIASVLLCGSAFAVKEFKPSPETTLSLAASPEGAEATWDIRLAFEVKGLSASAEVLVLVDEVSSGRPTRLLTQRLLTGSDGRAADSLELVSKGLPKPVFRLTVETAEERRTLTVP